MYVFVFIPVITAALNALALQAVTQPVSQMLNTILSSLPLIFAAMLILALTYVIGRVVSDLVATLLAGIGFNKILVWLGLGQEPAAGQRTPAQIAGMIILAAFMLFAAIEATQVLGFSILSQLVTQFTVFGGQLLTGLLIFAIGLYLANLTARAILASEMGQKGLFALVARMAILVLAGSMALRQVGLAADIINLAFSLILGAAAFAAALAFGLGGRETAAQILADWRKAAPVAGRVPAAASAPAGAPAPAAEEPHNP